MKKDSVKHIGKIGNDTRPTRTLVKNEREMRDMGFEGRLVKKKGEGKW